MSCGFICGLTARWYPPLARAALLFGVLLAGCASPMSDYQRMAIQETPAAWHVGSTWRFDVMARRKTESGEITLRFTDEHIGTCATNESWRKAEVVSTTITNPPLSIWYARDRGDVPAYLITGKNMLVLLNPWVCDNDIVLRGILEPATSTGVMQEEGMFGGDFLGRFEAKPAE